MTQKTRTLTYLKSFKLQNRKQRELKNLLNRSHLKRNKLKLNHLKKLQQKKRRHLLQADNFFYLKHFIIF
jgi:hypothetical protein